MLHPSRLILIGLLCTTFSGVASGQEPATTLAVSPLSAALNQELTLTAAVSPATAAGKVEFLDGSAVLGWAPLAAGQAVLRVRFREAGPHLVRAVYAGGDGYGRSASAAVQVAVTAHRTNGFAPAASYSVGFPFSGAAMADFDGDARPDMAVVASSGAAVLSGRADGTFALPVSPPAGASQTRTAAADFNADGKTDLAVYSAQTSSLAVMLGEGGGSFRSLPAIGGVHSAPAPADFDGNGTVDLAFAAAGGLGVLPGNGDGSFKPAVVYAGISELAGLSAGDFDGDGSADLAAANQNRVTVLFNNGDGSFRDGGYYSLGARPSCVGAADVNGDGAPDLIAIVPGGAVVLLGDGLGAFISAASYPTGAASGVGGFVASDLDGDGKIDLAVPSAAGVSVLIGDGDGVFQTAVTYPSGSSTAAAFAGDFNGDGRIDLLAANGSSGELALLLPTTPPAVITLRVSPTPSSRLGEEVGLIASVSPSDALGTVTFYDGDAALGVAMHDAWIRVASLSAGEHRLSAVYSGDATYAGCKSAVVLHTVVPPATDATATSLSVSPLASRLGDTVDLTATVTPPAAAGSVTFYEGTMPLGSAVLHSGQALFRTSMLAPGVHRLAARFGGDAMYAGSISSTVTQSTAALASAGFLPPSGALAGAAFRAAAIADFDNDGHADAVVGSGPVNLALGRGDGSFRTAVDTGAEAGPRDIAALDANRDGNTDLALIDFAGRLTVIHGNGDGTFQADMPARYPCATDAEWMAVADFNGDSFADLAVGGGEATVLFGKAEGGFSTPVTVHPGAVSRRLTVAAADLNGDGKPDLVLGMFNPSGPPGSLVVLLGKGDGSFQPAIDTGSPAHRFIATADFDGDGKTDVAAAAPGSGSDPHLSVSLGKGDGGFKTAIKTPLAAEPFALAAADLTGDGKTDLAVSFASGGGVALFAGAGDGTFAAPQVLLKGIHTAFLAAEDFNRDGRLDLGFTDALQQFTALLAMAPSSTTLSVSPASPGAPGQPSTLTAAVTPAAAQGAVAFYDGFTLLGSRPLTAGQASFIAARLAPGAHSLTARYLGEGLVAGSSASVSHTIRSAPASGFAQHPGFSMPVSSDSSPVFVTADFNGDGEMDLAVIRPETHALEIKLGSAGGGLETAGAYPLSGTLHRGAIAAADFNTDGRIDVAVAVSGSVLLYPGNGDGTLQSAAAVAAATEVTAGDFNRDGKPDLLLGSGEVLAGNGDGRFEDPVRQDIASGDRYLLDFNNDGIPDIAVNDLAYGAVVVHAGAGDGSFRAAGSLTVCGEFHQRSSAWGDFNGDGKTDLAALCGLMQPTQVSLYAGNGDGSFRPALVSPIPDSAWEIAGAADFDGDGNLDLALTDVTKLTIARGRGDGAFLMDTRQYLAGFCQPSQCPDVGATPGVVGDFDGDGRPDIVLMPARADRSIVLSGAAAASIALKASANSSGLGGQITLTATVSPAAATGRVYFSDGGRPLGTAALAGGIASLTVALPALPSHSLRATYGGDGVYDSSRSAALPHTVQAAPSSRFAPGGSYKAGSAPSSLAAGDFNADGKLDLAIANNGGGNVTILLGDGRGAFRAAGDYPAGEYPRDLAACDFDGDGKLDLAVHSGRPDEHSAVRFLPGNGDGTFRAGPEFDTGFHAAGILFGDFNRDANIDAVAAADHSVQVAPGSGNMAFGRAIYSPADEWLTGVAVGDFDGDGEPDLAAPSNDDSPAYPGVVDVMRGMGDGTFAQETRYTASDSPRAVAAADLNADGRTDLAVAGGASNPGSGTVTVLLGKGDGAFHPAVSYAAGASPAALVIADFDGDAKPDIATANGGSGAVAILHGNGDGTFQAPVSYTAGTNPAALAAADFNGDGRTDLAAANAGSGDVTVLLGAQARPATPSRIGTYSPATGLWRLDKNGDGAFSEAEDSQFYLGWPGAVRLQGDWNGDGAVKAGVYSDGFWFLDYNGNGVWEGGGVDRQIGWGWPGATPVTGDWNGDGKTKIGVYSAGFWFLDYDGDYLWHPTPSGGTDKQTGWGWQGATPVVGDWNGDGKTKIGVYSAGFWFLDYDGDYLWHPTPSGGPDKQVGWGWDGVQILMGDWNGDGRTKIGVTASNFYFLDYDGDYLWNPQTVGGPDKQVGWGWAAATTVFGDWNGDGKTKIGLYNAGQWLLDWDGDFAFDAASDKVYVFGGASDGPVTGGW